MNAINRIGFSSTNVVLPPLKNQEEVAEKVNTAVTGVEVVGIGAAAFIAKAIHSRAVKNPTGIIAKTGKAVENAARFVTGKAGDLSLTALQKSRIVQNTVSACAMAANKAAPILSRVKGYAGSFPKPVKIAAAVAAGLAGLSHIKRDGEIEGIFMEKQAEAIQ